MAEFDAISNYRTVSKGKLADPSSLGKVAANMMCVSFQNCYAH